jgi:hypothetical protein
MFSKPHILEAIYSLHPENRESIVTTMSEKGKCNLKLREGHPLMLEFFQSFGDKPDHCLKITGLTRIKTA